MPSPPPPTTLERGDPVWAHVGGGIIVGTVTAVDPSGRLVNIRTQSTTHNDVPTRNVHERTIYVPDVVGPGEARTLLDGISRQRFGELREQPHFPPAAELAIGPVWARPELLAWHRDRTDKRSTPRARFLMSYRKHGSVYAAAKSLGIATSSAYRWAHELGLLEGEPDA